MPNREVILFTKDVGEKLRTMRKYRRMTQEDLAVRANLCRQHVTVIELGQRCPSVSVLATLANALDCDIVFNFKPRDL